MPPRWIRRFLVWDARKWQALKHRLWWDAVLVRKSVRWLLTQLGRLRHGGVAVNFGDRNNRFFRLGWLTLDVVGPADLRANPGTEAIPLADNSVLAFTASHVFEHLTDQESLHALKEMRRCLKPGGCCRIVVPDVPHFIVEYRRDPAFRFFFDRPLEQGQTVEAGFKRQIAQGRQHPDILLPHNGLFSVVVSYVNGHPLHVVDKAELEARLEQGSFQDFVTWCVSLKATDKLDYGHCNGYDEEKLIKLGQAAGFTRAEISHFGEMESNLLFRGIDLYNKRAISIYVNYFK